MRRKFFEKKRSGGGFAELACIKVLGKWQMDIFLPCCIGWVLLRLWPGAFVKMGKDVFVFHSPSAYRAGYQAVIWNEGVNRLSGKIVPVQPYSAHYAPPPYLQS